VWLVTAVACVALALLARAAWRNGVGVMRTSGVRLGPGAAVVRGAMRVAAIERITQARGRGRLPLYVALARGAVVDSARVGVLAARLVAGTERGTEPVVALVPRDSVAGLAVVGRLVVTPGEPGLLVFGADAHRR
jgi:hypothetical protein